MAITTFTSVCGGCGRCVQGALPREAADIQVCSISSFPFLLSLCFSCSEDQRDSGGCQLRQVCPSCASRPGRLLAPLRTAPPRLPGAPQKCCWRRWPGRPWKDRGSCRTRRALLGVGGAARDAAPHLDRLFCRHCQGCGAAPSSILVKFSFCSPPPSLKVGSSWFLRSTSQGEVAAPKAAAAPGSASPRTFRLRRARRG